jgi:predicted permease
MMLSGGSIGRDWKRMFNVPVISILTALVLNLIGADRYIPDPVMKTVKILGQCAVPMGVILVGAIMADHAGGFRSASGWRTILAGCFLRLGLLPLLMVLLAWSLPCSMELKRILILQGAMPTAVFTIVMSKHYAGDPLTALRLVIGTSVAALVTIPLWLRFGFWVIGQK